MFPEKIFDLYRPLRGKNKADFDKFLEDWTLVNPYKDYWDRFEFFVKKYYQDSLPKDLIIALNPGRKGCNKTGIALTDEKILKTKLNYPELIPEPEEENTAQRVYQIIEEVFPGDICKFFSCYFLTNVFPFGVISQSKNNRTENVNFCELIKIKSINEYSRSFVKSSIKRFKPKRLLCVGKESKKFIAINFPDYDSQYLWHPSRKFPESEKEKWRHALRQ